MKTGEIYNCPKCGKTYVIERHYKQHIEKCNYVNEEDFVVELDDDDVIIINNSTEKYQALEPSMEKKLFDFFESLDGRPIKCRYDVEILFSFFRWIYPKSTLILDPNCPQCVKQIYDRVYSYYEKIKETNEIIKKNQS